MKQVIVVFDLETVRPFMNSNLKFNQEKTRMNYLYIMRQH